MFIRLFNTVQVQEKKVKRVSEMHLNASQAVENGSIAVSSTSSPRKYLQNGGQSDRLNNNLHNGLSFPPGGIPSLCLPVVLHPTF